MFTAEGWCRSEPSMAIVSLSLTLAESVLYFCSVLTMSVFTAGERFYIRAELAGCQLPLEECDRYTDAKLRGSRWCAICVL